MGPGVGWGGARLQGSCVWHAPGYLTQIHSTGVKLGDSLDTWGRGTPTPFLDKAVCGYED